MLLVMGESYDFVSYVFISSLCGYELCSKHEMKRLTVNYNSLYEANVRHDMY